MALSGNKKPGKRLGRGLDALLGEAPAPISDSASDTASEQGASGPTQTLPVAFLRPNPTQPRRIFNEDAIDELASSIKARGLLQPILVRPAGKDDYEIVAGERRWRAAQKAKLHEVPVLIRELTDEESAEIALIENVQRVDLNPMEEAEAYHRLSEVYARTQEEIAKAVGKSRSHIANIMRLLTLPETTRKAVSEGEISMGHARALIGTDDPDALCVEVIRGELSVRETENLVRSLAAGEGAVAQTPAKTKPKASKDADTRALEADLAAALGLEVEISHQSNGAGSVTISYLNLDQLDEVCRRLMDTSV